MLRLCLLGQLQHACCYGCDASQGRTSLSAVSVAPEVFFQLPRSLLTYPGSVNSETDSQPQLLHGHCGGTFPSAATASARALPPVGTGTGVASHSEVCAVGEETNRKDQKQCRDGAEESRQWLWFQFSSVSQSCPTLFDPMDCSMPGLPLLKLMSIELVMPSKHLILCRPLLLPSTFPSIKVFAKVSSLHQVAKVLEFQL